MRTEVKGRQRESGAALLLMMLVVIVGGAAMLVTKLNRHSARVADTTESGVALARARDALLAYAATYPDMQPGSPLQLPCPDIDAGGSTLDGESHTASCGAPGVSVMGRLPWRTLGIEAPRDGASECLWYVVSGDYKSAGPTTATMINPDTNGQLQLFDAASGDLIEGLLPDERPVALILAAGQALPGQSRQAIAQPGQQCTSDFNAAAFLDTDPGTGISNAALSGSVGIDSFVRAAGEASAINDRIVSISREALADQVYGRLDFATAAQDLTEAIAGCIADYGRNNPGGPDDRRLPWPTSVALTDYRVDVGYDDLAGGILSGRLADTVDDSNSLTGNPIARALADCSNVAVPTWDAAMQSRWQHWKDHFFYFVSASFSPSAAVPTSCTDCVTVNGGGPYAAVVLFAGRRLEALSQIRDAPPLDTDTRDDISNYLESSNLASHPYSAGTVDLESRASAADFNDLLYCVDPALNVVAC